MTRYVDDLVEDLLIILQKPGGGCRIIYMFVTIKYADVLVLLASEKVSRIMALIDMYRKIL